MKKVGGIVLLMVCLFLGYAEAVMAGEMANEITMSVNSSEATLDERKVTLDTIPIIINGSTMVPVRFIGEAFGANFIWDKGTQQITFNYGTTQIKLWIDKNEAEINGVPQVLSIPPKLIKDRTMVPLRFIAEVIGCDVKYQSESKIIKIIKPNTIPVAKFEIDKSVASLGENVNYQDLSIDPDGDLIVDRVWSNNNKVFQIPGVFTVGLKVKDSRGAWSDWHYQSIEIIDKPNTMPVANFTLDVSKAYVDQVVKYTDNSSDPDGEEIVDWIWKNRNESFKAPGIYEVGLKVKDRRGLWSDWYYQSIEIVEQPNDPPVAFFKVKQSVNQGETVNFEDLSYDPDGDEIVEYKWTGKKRAYFQAGAFLVTLQVKDKRGKWSEIYTQEITVTEKVVMNEMQYNLNNPLPGEVVNLTGYNPVNFPVLKPVSKSFDNTVLLMSNSPETVIENGILYRDMVSGNVRLLFSHKNSTTDRKRIYVLAENIGREEACITISKKGWGGPSTDELAIGRIGLTRYLASDLNNNMEIAPGQTIVLEGAGEGRVIPANNSVYGMIDLFVKGDINITFVMVDAGSDVLTTYHTLPELARDVHPRGTFIGANRVYEVEMSGNEPQRFIFSDGKTDGYLGGIDALTGLNVINKGNYGVLYTMKINTDTRTGILTNPRGGAFLGASKSPDGTIYSIPNAGVIKTGSQAAMNMILHQHDSGEYIFSPPASSYMPVSLLFMPF